MGKHKEEEIEFDYSIKTTTYMGDKCQQIDLIYKGMPDRYIFGEKWSKEDILGVTVQRIQYMEKQSKEL